MFTDGRSKQIVFVAHCVFNQNAISDGTNDKYTYRITWSEDDNEYVGLCAEFPSLSWLAKTPEKALSGIRKVVAEAIFDMRENNEKIPEPIASKHYSGKFMVRIPHLLMHRG